MVFAFPIVVAAISLFSLSSEPSTIKSRDGKLGVKHALQGRWFKDSHSYSSFR